MSMQQQPTGINTKITDKEKEIFYGEIYHTFEEAGTQGIYEAYYFIGLMNLKGIYTKVNKKKAFYYLTLSASCSHALSFYEIYKL
jgi:TPR repeat protein